IIYAMPSNSFLSKQRPNKSGYSYIYTTQGWQKFQHQTDSLQQCNIKYFWYLYIFFFDNICVFVE
ncbi:MAG: hypothetical protein V7L25_23815, partial [Nostoc sp.]|uniref:hypothetical protein n=1 Tax=Nostoc sp. TaxID=1180 RepID=UPI002FF179B6